ncbi:uncharacterized protein LOC131689321 [Topomyia yanbarensis]|uniref:uncharacterized protein LOC131689321 n=1 Tax=Topomyia yanbarensis TaxID=2498891 RepID=UPI00273BF646|nr:uncharacterized protein LOC131689321 [Topomyia yanbarensis]XP_058830320.1 uncharacterized protein LOC131689321 [Topomyia yanbarensis]XP_058830328.1 uncharacterized protein LOC131689321 [Topomyia yanbarensis]
MATNPKDSKSPTKLALPSTSAQALATTTDKSAEITIALPENWTKIASKKRPGMHYYFNIKTKESLWEHPGQSKALELEQKIIRNVPKAPIKPNKPSERSDKMRSSEKVIQLKNDTQFKKRNTAKSRLEALQKQLEIERKQNAEKNKIQTEKKKSPEKKVEPKKVDASLSPRPRKRAEAAEKVSVSPKTIITKKSSRDSPKVSPRSKVIARNHSPKVVDNKRKAANLLAEAKEDSLKDAKKPTSSLKMFKIPKKPPDQPVKSPLSVVARKPEEPKVIPLNEMRDNIPSQLKTDYTTKLPRKLDTPVRDPLIPIIPPTIPMPSVRNVLLEAIERLPSPVVQSPVARSEPPKYTSTPKLETRSPANERLSKIRTELAEEVILQTSVLGEDTEMTDLSELSIPSDGSFAEEMDWEDIPEELAVQKVVAVRQKLDFQTSPLPEKCSNTSIPQFQLPLFDSINYRRFFFMVLDTNIFLSHLKGLERMLQKGFPHIGQPILLIPYIVLQELDRIKHRTQDPLLSQAASHSIRFLNEKLRQRDPRVKGQSTLEAAHRLIEIANPDDNIVNCCLQVKQAIAGLPTELMLLSNDINLRNKLLVNGVQAFSFTELTAEADRIRFTSDDGTGTADSIRS